MHIIELNITAGMLLKILGCFIACFSVFMRIFLSVTTVSVCTRFVFIESVFLILVVVVRVMRRCAVSKTSIVSDSEFSVSTRSESTRRYNADFKVSSTSNCLCSCIFILLHALSIRSITIVKILFFKFAF